MFEKQKDESCLVYTIQENGETVKTVMLENMNFSKKLSKKLEINRQIFLNNKTTKLRKKTYLGDILSIKFDDEKDEYDFVNIPLDIIYEDKGLLVINKPPFIVVHPTKSHYNNTIANGIAYYFKQKNIKKKVRFVNRLDMNTSGIVIVAKNPYIHNELSIQMKENNVGKIYYGIVEGSVEKEIGTIKEPITRLNKDDIIREVHPSGKECITHFKVEKKLKNATLLKIRIETGRTHQIRVHMKYIGHPVIGDTLYGKENVFISRQALHCGEMTFKDPITKEKINLCAPIPEDFKNLMDNLKM